MLALEAYAYYVVFVLPLTDAALIYLRKPFYGLAMIARHARRLHCRGRARLVASELRRRRGDRVRTGRSSREP